MEKTLLEKLESEIDQCTWESLKPHFLRGALFLVSSELELSVVGLAIARDQAEYISSWMKQGKITKLTQNNVQKWEESPTEICAQFLIIQPYVLIKSLS